MVRALRAPRRLVPGGGREAVDRADRGLVDADLGGGLIKQRVARDGGGRSGGYRTIIAFRSQELAVFLYCFAKQDQENVTSRELAKFRDLGRGLLARTTGDLMQMVGEGELDELRGE
jgi:hypothetical protein